MDFKRMSSAKVVKRFLSVIILTLFTINSIIPAQAQFQGGILPKVGSMVNKSISFEPSIVKGITIDPTNPLAFDFIVDTGDNRIAGEELKSEATKMIKYFLASLTVPEKDLWVNLSPYEKGRIIANEFGQTEMGRDLLALDYILKQLTASLIYPESDLGREFWSKVRAKVQAQFGTTDLPVNTFNKVWIVPNKAVVYEHGNSAFVVESHLKVMLEEDYLSMQKNAVILTQNEVKGKDLKKDSSSLKIVPQNDTNKIGSQIIRDVLIPQIEEEVNTGKNFANLRQIYNSMILAVWYKKNLRDSLLGKVYMDQNKVKGTEYTNSVILSAAKDLKKDSSSLKSIPQNDVEAIYQQYIHSFKKGAYNYIKEEMDPITKQVMPRKYFSGGAVGVKDSALVTINTQFLLSPKQRQAIPSGDSAMKVGVVLGENPLKTDAAMAVRDPENDPLIEEIIAKDKGRQEQLQSRVLGVIAQTLGVAVDQIDLDRSIGLNPLFNDKIPQVQAALEKEFGLKEGVLKRIADFGISGITGRVDAASSMFKTKLSSFEKGASLNIHVPEDKIEELFKSLSSIFKSYHVPFSLTNSAGRTVTFAGEDHVGELSSFLSTDGGAFNVQIKLVNSEMSQGWYAIDAAIRNLLGTYAISQGGLTERKSYSFSPGPAMIAASVWDAKREMTGNYNGTGRDLSEGTFASAAYAKLQSETKAKLRALLGVPENFEIFLLPRPATDSYATVVRNLLSSKGKALYINSGVWSKNAIAAAREIAKGTKGFEESDIQVIASSEDDQFSHLPSLTQEMFNQPASFVHMTWNNTVYGTEWKELPDTNGIPLVLDATSNIFSRPISDSDWKKIGVIYAGAQKNIGLPGFSVTIVHKDLIGEPIPGTPRADRYDNWLKTEYFVTPPTDDVMTLSLVLDEFKQRGGVKVLSAQATERSRILYDVIDSSNGFYQGLVTNKADRSRMNVTFRLRNPELTEKFHAEAEAQGLFDIKGFQEEKGGPKGKTLRASIYNGMPLEGVWKLAQFMKDFQAKYASDVAMKVAVASLKVEDFLHFPYPLAETTQQRDGWTSIITLKDATDIINYLKKKAWLDDNGRFTYAFNESITLENSGIKEAFPRLGLYFNQIWDAIVTANKAQGPSDEDQALVATRIRQYETVMQVVTVFGKLAHQGIPDALKRVGFNVSQNPVTPGLMAIKLGNQTLFNYTGNPIPQTDYSQGNGLYALSENRFILKIQDSYFVIESVPGARNSAAHVEVQEYDSTELASERIQVGDGAMASKNPLAKSGVKRTTTKAERAEIIRQHRHRTRYEDGVYIKYVNTPEQIAAAQKPIQNIYTINERVGRKYRRQQREHFRNGTTTGTYGVTNQVEAEALVNRSGKVVESEISDQDLLEILGLDASRSQVDLLRQDLINQGYLGIDKKITRELIELDPINFKLANTYQGIEKLDVYFGLLNLFWFQIKAIYQGGWAEIMKYFGASDQAKAPTNYLSLEPAEISNLLMMHAMHQEEKIASMNLTPLQEEAYRASRKYVDFYIPIVMDIDHGHGQPQQIIHVNLTAGRDGNLIAAVHLENQCHKKCGHMSRKSLKPTVVWEDATNQVREMLEVLGFYDVSIVDRADSEDAEVMSGNVDGRDQEFMLGLTTNLISPERWAQYRADQESELRTKLLKDVEKNILKKDQMEKMIAESLTLLDTMAKFMIDEYGVLKSYQDVMDYAEYDLNLGGADQEAVDQLWKDLADVKRLDDLIEETLIAQGANAKMSPQQWLEFLQSIPRNYETKYTQLVIKKAKELGIIIHSRDAWVSHKEWQTGVMENGLVHLLWDNNVTKINEDGYDLYMFGGGVEASVAHHLAILAISDQLWSEQKKAFGLDTIIWAMALDQGAVDLLIKEDFWGLLEGHEKIKKEKGDEIVTLLRRYLIQRRIVPQEAFLKTRESLEKFGLSAELAVHLINSVSKTKANNNSPSFRWALQKIGVSKEHLQRTINNILKFLPSFKHVATKPEDLQRIWEETHSSFGLKAEPVIGVKRFMTEDEKKNFIRVQGRDVQFQFSTYLGEVKNHVLTQLFLQGYEGQEAEAKLKEILLQVFGPGFINNEAYVISKLQELGFAMGNAFTEDTQTFAGVKYDAYLVTIGKGKAQRFAAIGGKNDEQKESLAAQIRSKEKAELEVKVSQARERIQSATTASALSDLIVEYHSWLEAARKKVTKFVNDRDVAKAAMRTDIEDILNKLKHAKEDRELISPLVAEAIDKILPLEGAESVTISLDIPSLENIENRFNKYPGIYENPDQGVRRDLFVLRSGLRSVDYEKRRAEGETDLTHLKDKEGLMKKLIEQGKKLIGDNAMITSFTEKIFTGLTGDRILDEKDSKFLYRALIKSGFLDEKGQLTSRLTHATTPTDLGLPNNYRGVQGAVLEFLKMSLPRQRVINPPGTRNLPIQEVVDNDGKAIPRIHPNRVGTAKKERQVAKVDSALLSAPGGINLDPSLMNLQIKRDGLGIPLPISQQPIGSMKIDGFMPIIIKIEPVSNMSMLLGFNPPVKKTVDYGMRKPNQLAKEPEQLALLK